MSGLKVVALLQITPMAERVAARRHPVLVPSNSLVEPGELGLEAPRLPAVEEVALRLGMGYLVLERLEAMVAAHPAHLEGLHLQEEVRVVLAQALSIIMELLEQCRVELVEVLGETMARKTVATVLPDKS